MMASPLDRCVPGAVPTAILRTPVSSTMSYREPLGCHDNGNSVIGRSSLEILAT